MNISTAVMGTGKTERDLQETLSDLTFRYLRYWRGMQDLKREQPEYSKPEWTPGIDVVKWEDFNQWKAQERREDEHRREWETVYLAWQDRLERAEYDLILFIEKYLLRGLWFTTHRDPNEGSAYIVMLAKGWDEDGEIIDVLHITESNSMPGEIVTTPHDEVMRPIHECPDGYIVGQSEYWSDAELAKLPPIGSSNRTTKRLAMEMMYGG